MDDCCQLNGQIFIKGEHSENIYQMIPKEKALRQYGDIVYGALSSLIECTFGELQRICQIEDTDLCFALMYLLKQNKVMQQQHDGAIYYRVKLLGE